MIMLNKVKLKYTINQIILRLMIQIICTLIIIVKKFMEQLDVHGFNKKFVIYNINITLCKILNTFNNYKQLFIQIFLKKNKLNNLIYNFKFV